MNCRASAQPDKPDFQAGFRGFNDLYVGNVREWPCHLTSLTIS